MQTTWTVEIVLDAEDYTLGALQTKLKNLLMMAPADAPLELDDRDGTLALVVSWAQGNKPSSSNTPYTSYRN